MSSDLNRLRKCFQPRQWFRGDGEFDPSVISDEDTFMWVYKKNAQGLFEVGFHEPDGAWSIESVHESAHQAAAHVNFLNGGKR